LSVTLREIDIPLRVAGKSLQLLIDIDTYRVCRCPGAETMDSTESAILDRL